MSKTKNKKPNVLAKKINFKTPLKEKIHLDQATQKEHKKPEQEHFHAHHHKKEEPHNHQESKNSKDSFGEKISKISKHMSDNLVSYTNSVYIDNVKLLKGFFSCSNLHDLITFQENLINHNFKNYVINGMEVSSDLLEHSHEITNIIITNYHQCTNNKT